MAAPMKRQQPSEAGQGGEELPATPAAKRQRSRGVQGRPEQQQGSGQAGSKGFQAAGAGRPPARSSPLPSADVSPAVSAGEAAVPAADTSGEQEWHSQPSETAEQAGEEAPAVQLPPPALAAKQRSRAKATQPQQQGAAGPGDSHEFMQQLADAAADQAGGGSHPAGATKEEEGAGGGSNAEPTCRPPAAGPVVRGPTFSLARGAEPPCYRIWLSLQAPCSAEDVTVLCKRHYIQVTQRVGGDARSPDGLCLPPPPPVQVHHLVLPEPLDLTEPVQALVTPRGECYIEAAIQAGRRRNGSSSEGAASEG